MKLIAKATIQIGKPVHEVFEAIVDPAGMRNYFISESSGRMEEGSTVTWKFPEFEDKFPVNITKVEKDRAVYFVWDKGTEVRINLEPFGPATIVRVEEDGKEGSEENLKWVIQNTEGWANFLACMKAWLEHGVRLREGAFDFMKK